MIATHHHVPSYVRAVEAERLERLVSAAARGEASAWGAIVARFTGLTRDVARRQGLNHHDAEDVAQSTFTRLYINIDSLRDPRALPGWLKTTAQREGLRVIATRTREVPAEQLKDEPDVTGPAPDELALLALDGAALAAAIARLPEHQRVLLECLYGDAPRTYQEAAEELGIPIGSVGPTVVRALARLRRDAALVAAAR